MVSLSLFLWVSVSPVHFLHLLHWCWTTLSLLPSLIHFHSFSYPMRPSLPQIAISLAPPEEIQQEPYSPLTPNAWPTTPPGNDDGFRSQYLSPPPSASSPRFPRQLSPLRPPDSPVKGSGLERERFDALLKASQERSAFVGARKSADLRKEIAMRAHKEKQSTWLSNITCEQPSRPVLTS